MDEIRAFYLENKVLQLAYFVIKSESGTSVKSKILRKGASVMIDLSEADGKIKDGETVWLELIGSAPSGLKRGLSRKPSIKPDGELTMKRVSSKKFIYREASPFRANYGVIVGFSRSTKLPKYSLLFTGLERFFDDGMDDENPSVQVEGIYYYLGDDGPDDKDKTATVGENPAKYRGEIIIPEYIVYKGNKYQVDAICDMAFDQCEELTKVVIPNTVTYIGTGAFDGCSRLDSVVIPDGMTEIKNFTFVSCSNLRSLTLSANLYSIGLMAFGNCSSLKKIIAKRDSPYLVAEDTFEGVDKMQCTVYVPKGCKKDYVKNWDWRDFIIVEG